MRYVNVRADNVDEVGDVRAEITTDNTQVNINYCIKNISSMLIWYCYCCITMFLLGNTAVYVFFIIVSCSMHPSGANVATGLILGLRPANERRRYRVTPSHIGSVQT